MSKIYTIEILCKDTDNTIYNDNHRVGYETYRQAKEVLNKMIKQEYDNLMENKDKYQDYYITDYIEDNEEICEREIYYKTDDYEDLLTRYSIVVIEIKKTRYDMEENFAIDDDLAKKINYMVYKGIQVRYIFDTNTIIFSRENANLDEEDLDTIIYRNYTEKDLKKYIDTELNNYTKELGEV